jgi:hypothetical protein
VCVCHVQLFFLCFSPKTIIAMPDISPVANCFAVVGLADVLVRLSVQASGIYERYRTSSKDAARLLKELKTLVDIVTEVRVYANDYKQSPYVLDDGLTQLPQLEETLQACKTEVEALIQSAEAATGSLIDGWLKHVSRGLKWALDDGKVRESCQRIEQLKATLITILALTGR